MTEEAAEVWRRRLDDDEYAARRSRSLLLIANTDYCSRYADAEATFWHYDRYHPRRVLRQVAAKRQILEMYEHAVAAHRAGSVSKRNGIQDETAVEFLGEIIRLLTEADEQPPPEPPDAPR